MSHTMKLIKLGVSGLACISLITACADRFGSFKSRRVTESEYDTWAVKNGKPTVAQIRAKQAEKTGNSAGRSSVEPGLSRVTPNTRMSPTERPQTAPGLSGGANSQVVGGGSPQQPTYAKGKWMANYEALIKTHSPQAKELIKGITISSGLSADRTKTLFVVQAVVVSRFDELPYALRMTTQLGEEVKFDGQKAPTYSIEMSRTEGGVGNSELKKNIILSASCLKDEKPCTEFAVQLDFNLGTPPAANGDIETVAGVFRVVTVNAAGIVDSNMKGDLKTYAQGLEILKLSNAVVPATGAVGGGSGLTVDVNSRDSDAVLLETAKNVTATLKEHNAKAIAAAKAAEGAQRAKQKDEAEKQAAAAKVAADGAVADNEMLKKLMNDSEGIMSQLKTQDAKNIAVKILEVSQVLADVAVKAAGDARKSADDTAGTVPAAAPTAPAAAVEPAAPAAPATAAAPTAPAAPAIPVVPTAPASPATAVEPTAPATRAGVSGSALNNTTDPEGLADLLIRQQQEPERMHDGGNY